MNQVFVREMLPVTLNNNNKVKTAIVCLLSDMVLDSIFNIGCLFFSFFRQVLGAFSLVFCFR